MIFISELNVPRGSRLETARRALGITVIIIRLLLLLLLLLYYHNSYY